MCNQYTHSIYVPTWFKTLVCVSFVSICFPYPVASCRFSTRKSRQYLILFWIFELVTIIDFSAPVCYFSKLRSIWGPLLWTGQWPHIDHWVTTTPRWSRTEDGIKERITRIHMAPRGAQSQTTPLTRGLCGGHVLRLIRRQPAAKGRLGNAWGPAKTCAGIHAARTGYIPSRTTPALLCTRCVPLDLIKRCVCRLEGFKGYRQGCK